MNRLTFDNKEILDSKPQREERFLETVKVDQLRSNCLEKATLALSNSDYENFCNSITVNKLNSEDLTHLFLFCLAEEKEEKFLKTILESKLAIPTEINRIIVQASDQEWFKKGPAKKVLSMIDQAFIEKEPQTELLLPLLIERMIAAEESKNSLLVRSLLEKLEPTFFENKKDIFHQLFKASIENKWYTSLNIILKYSKIEEKEYLEFFSYAIENNDPKLLESLAVQKSVIEEDQLLSFYTFALVEKCDLSFFKVLLNHYPLSSENLSSLLCHTMENNDLSYFKLILKSDQQIAQEQLIGILNHSIFQERTEFVNAILDSDRYIDSENLTIHLEKKDLFSQKIKNYCNKQEKTKKAVHQSLEKANTAEVRKQIQDFINKTPPSLDSKEIYAKIAKDYRRMNLKARNQKKIFLQSNEDSSKELLSTHLIPKIEELLEPLFQHLSHEAKNKILANFNQDLAHPFIHLLITEQEILIEGKKSYFCNSNNKEDQKNVNNLEMIVGDKTTEIYYSTNFYLYNQETFPVYFSGTFSQTFDNKTGESIDSNITINPAPFLDNKTSYKI